MTVATRHNLIPYSSKVECSHCGYKYVPRSRNPRVCPRCRKPFLATVIREFDELRARLIHVEKSVMKIRVAASDTEFQGNISNPRAFEWFSKARIEYFREYGGLSVGDDRLPRIEGKYLVVVLVNTSCTFHSTAGFDDLLELITSVSHVGDHSLVFSHELHNLSRGNALVAKGEATQVFLDPKTKQKAPVPQSLRWRKIKGR